MMKDNPLSLQNVPALDGSHKGPPMLTLFRSNDALIDSRVLWWNILTKTPCIPLTTSPSKSPVLHVKSVPPSLDILNHHVDYIIISSLSFNRQFRTDCRTGQDVGGRSRDQEQGTYIPLLLKIHPLRPLALTRTQQTRCNIHADYILVIPSSSPSRKQTAMTAVATAAPRLRNGYSPPAGPPPPKKTSILLHYPIFYPQFPQFPLPSLTSILPTKPPPNFHRPPPNSQLSSASPAPASTAPSAYTSPSSAASPWTPSSPPN